jgi:phytoene dehydrogenase-like protein
MSVYDVIVVGAGHNGLTCAAYLARAGLRVLALDRYSDVGGMTITEELVAPGLLSDVHASGYLGPSCRRHPRSWSSPVTAWS